jgi:hypothetical protein
MTEKTGNNLDKYFSSCGDIPFGACREKSWTTPKTIAGALKAHCDTGAAMKNPNVCPALSDTKPIPAKLECGILPFLPPPVGYTQATLGDADVTELERRYKGLCSVGVADANICGALGVPLASAPETLVSLLTNSIEGLKGLSLVASTLPKPGAPST